jgi:hypothetical protein
MEARQSRILPMLLVLALSSGCTITLGGGFDETAAEGSEPGTAPPLPQPTVWRVEPPQLTPEQQQRKDEVDAFLAEQFRDYKVIEATQGYSGDITYWVDSNSIPGAFPDPPPPAWTQEDLTPPPGVQIGRAEIELYPELRGPAGTTPMHRPDYMNYVMGETDAGSLQEYIDNQALGLAPGQHRLYAGLIYNIPNMGVSGHINQFHGEVERYTFSLIEVTVACIGSNPPSTIEQVGAVISRDRRNFQDSKPRLHVEFITPRAMGWDTGHFIAQPGRPYGPGGEVLASEPGLSTQHEHFIDIHQDAAGNWWISHNGNTLGHYPARLFKVLNGAACTAAWYGELYDETPSAWTWTDMGSGEFQSAGYGYAAYIRDPKWRDLLFTSQFPVDDPVFKTTYMGPYVEKCYDRSPLTVGAPPWSRYTYLGGPGGDAPGCTP